MSKRHPDLVHFIDIQNILTNELQLGHTPTSQYLQNRHFGSYYDPDSRYQAEIVYNAIIRGRDNAIELWYDYVQDGGLLKDIKTIVDTQPERIEEELSSEDFKEFQEHILKNGSNNHKESLMKELGQHPAIAIAFHNKMLQYSKQKNNFVISTTGRTAQWFIPTFWAWNIREYGLYYRSIETIGKQLERGIKTKVLLPSKLPIKKALEIRTNLKAALTDGTSWRCPNCGVYNIETMIQCTICETPKEAED